MEAKQKEDIYSLPLAHFQPTGLLRRIWRHSLDAVGAILSKCQKIGVLSTQL